MSYSLSKKLVFYIFSLAIFTNILFAQNGTNGSSNNGKPYTKIARELVDKALTERKAYMMLRELTQGIGSRLSGSPQAAAAVEWGRQTMLNFGLQNVYLEEVIVPRWVRGPIEKAAIVNSSTLGTVQLAVCALGGSIGTSGLGITAEVIEVHNFQELKSLGSKVKGKIVFFNRPMDPQQRTTFQAYSGAVNQRSQGAIEASKIGAAAVLVRSMTTRLDNVPHTGAMRYNENVPKIPAAAISTMDAELLSQLIKKEKRVHVNLQLSCKTLPDVPSANVIGEIVGTESPEEVIVIGGHLDSWDKGEGAHDDGTGCVQSIEALRLIKAMDLKPKRTIRAVLFMNEENGTRGGKTYAKNVGKNGLKHIAAIESDRGGFTPKGFSVSTNGDKNKFKNVSRWAYLFEDIGAGSIQPGFGGVDITPLMQHGTTTIGLVVDSQRYFDYHHSDNDTFDKVNERELELGAAAMAILAYVLSMEGL